MKRNYSMPKMNFVEISNRLNRLKARHKPRLQFPTRVQSKKHYFQYANDHVVLGQDQNQNVAIKTRVRNNLDISDIDGTKPKVIQKQKNVMNYYHNKNQQYNPFVPMETVIMRAISQPKLSQSKAVKQHVDSLDMLQRQMQRKLIINPQNKLPPININSSQNKRQVTEPSMASYQSDILLKKIPSYQNKVPSYQNRAPSRSNKSRSNNSNMSNRIKQSGIQRKSLVFNPTFLSNLVLL